MFGAKSRYKSRQVKPYHNQINTKKLKISKSTLVIILFVTTLISLKSSAQDTIYPNSESDLIIAKILEVNPNNLKYKNYSNIDGPMYTIEKSKIEKVVYQNGDVEMYSNDNRVLVSFGKQVSETLIEGSRLFLVYSQTEGEGNVDGDDAVRMLKDYIEVKTTCTVVNSIDNADFIVNLYVVKKAMADRKAMITIKHILTDREVFKSKWARGSSSAFSGYSGTRAAIDNVIKKYLLSSYPKIRVKNY